MAEPELFEKFSQGRGADAAWAVVGHGVKAHVEGPVLAGIKRVQPTNNRMFLNDADFFIEHRQPDARGQARQSGTYNNNVVMHWGLFLKYSF